MKISKTALQRAVVVGLRDVIGVIGAASVVFGVHLMHPPTAFIVAGAMLMAFAVAAARRSGA